MNIHNKCEPIVKKQQIIHVTVPLRWTSNLGHLHLAKSYWIEDSVALTDRFLLNFYAI